MRIVAWNIRGGGGERAARIARQLGRWAPDVVVLSEFRGTPPSRALAAAVGLSLAACGGQVEATPRAGRGEPTPVLGTLASSGPGTAELRAGDLPAARAAFESALGADPDRVAPLNDLAVSYYLDGRFEAARRLLDEVVARGGAREQQAALVNLGELYALEGYVSAAHAHLESARGIDASRAEPLYALAMLADARGERAQAAATLREALRLDESGAARRMIFGRHMMMHGHWRHGGEGVPPMFVEWHRRAHEKENSPPPAEQS